MHADLGRYWYSTSASLNRIAADKAGQLEEALVLMEIDKALNGYINSLGDRGHFEAVQVSLGTSADVPDEAGGVRARTEERRVWQACVSTCRSRCSPNT